MAFRAHITEIKSGDDGSVLITCWIQRQASGGGWKNIENRNIRLTAGTILEIKDDDQMTTQQKKQAIANLFRQQVESWGVHSSIEAAHFMRNLIDELPVNVTIDG